MLKTYLYLFRNPAVGGGSAATVVRAETFEQADELAMADAKDYLVPSTSWEACSAVVEIPEAVAGHSKFTEERTLRVDVDAAGKATWLVKKTLAETLGAFKPSTNEELSA